MLEYCGCCLYTVLNGDFMVVKSIEKINTKSQFIYAKNDFLNPELYSLLCILSFKHILTMLEFLDTL